MLVGQNKTLEDNANVYFSLIFLYVLIDQTNSDERENNRPIDYNSGNNQTFLPFYSMLVKRVPDFYTVSSLIVCTFHIETKCIKSHVDFVIYIITM